MMLIERAAGRGAFKGAALVGAFGIIVAAWWWDASLLTAAADANLQFIKIVTSKLPFDWGSEGFAKFTFSVPVRVVPQAHIVRVSDGQSHVDFPLRLFNLTTPAPLL